MKWACRGEPTNTLKYYRNLSDETIKKLNAEQESFIRATEDLRQTRYEAADEKMIVDRKLDAEGQYGHLSGKSPTAPVDGSAVAAAGNGPESN